MDEISRIFRVNRNGVIKRYPFTTWSIVHDRGLWSNSVKGQLFKYLSCVMVDGIPEGERRSVSQMSPLMIEVEKWESDIVKLCKDSGASGNGSFQHEICQKHFMEFDLCTVAYEIPVFDSELLGHVDLIRLVDNKIWVCDYKPNAHKETKAASQVERYIRLLMKSLSLPRSSFIGIYFDHINSYFIKP